MNSRAPANLKSSLLNSKSVGVAIFLLIVLKVGCWTSLGPAAIVGDAQGYWKLSSWVANGDIMMMDAPIAYRTPIYPWLLAGLREGSPGFVSPLLAVAIVQAILYLATVYLAGELAVQISRRASARTFTTLAMLPAISALTYIGFLVSEILFVSLLMMHLLSVIRYSENSSFGRAALVGLTLGLTLLTRPIVLLLWIPHLFFILTKHVLSREHESNTIKMKHRLGHVMLATIIVITLCVPWLARNHRLFGEAFLTEFLGRNIWIVTFQDGSGAGLDMPESQSAEELQERIVSVTNGNWFDSDWRHTWTVSNLLTKSGLSDPAADRLMKTVAIEAMTTQPKTVAYKTIRRCVNFWRCPANQLPIASPDHSGFEPYPTTWSTNSEIIKSIASLAFRFRVSQSVLANTIVMILIGFSVLSLTYNQPTRIMGLWIASVLLYFSAVTGVVEIPDYRYRMVIEPLCASAIGSALSLIWPRGHAQKTEPASDVSV